MRKLPSRNSGTMRRALTTPNILATLAVLVSMSGTAYAANRMIVITGANVRNNTIESRDVRNLSLHATEFSAMTRLKLRVRGPQGFAGSAGLPGEQGESGPVGNAGAKGATGDKGQNAPKAYTHNKVTQSARIKGHHPNKSAAEAWTIPSCAEDPLIVDCDTGASKFPRWNYACTSPHCGISTTSTGTRQTPSYQSLLLVSSASGGLLDMPFAGTVVLNASATFYTQRTTTFQRIECQLQLDRVTDAAPAIDVGEPVTVARWISRDGDGTQLNETERLLNVTVSGAVAQEAGLFGAQLACSAPDDNENPNDQLEFIEGNIRLLSTRTNGQA